MNRKKIIGIILIFTSILMFAFRGSSLFLVDGAAENYFNSSISTASKILISVMAIDSVLSILKDTEPTIDVFAGMSFAAGEIVDPAEDMVDRLTDVLTISIISLSAQRLIHEVGKNEVAILLSILILLIGTHLIFNYMRRKVFSHIVNVTVFLVIVRLLLPISAGVSTYIESAYFDKAIAKSMEAVVIESDKFEKLKSFEVESSSSTWKTLVGTKNMIVEKGSIVTEIVLDKIKNFDEFISAMIQIAGSYILLFILQVLLLPVVAILSVKYMVGLRFSTSSEP